MLQRSPPHANRGRHQLTVNHHALPPGRMGCLPPAQRPGQPLTVTAAAAAADAASAPDAPAPAGPDPSAPFPPVAAAAAPQAARRGGAARAALVAVHAASSAVFMAGAAGVELLTTLPVLATGRGALYYPASGAAAWAWAGLVAASAASGWALAARERRGAERANFQDYAAQAVLGQLFTLWLSPYWPRGYSPAADAAMGAAIVALSAAQLATQASAAHRAAIARGRRARPAAAAAAAPAAALPAAAPAELPGWAASAAYFQPAAVGPVMMLAAGTIQACVPTAWLAGFQAVHPEHAAVAFHFGLITTLAGHAGMFAPTLRDKRRISQRAEAAVCVLSSYGALALLAAFMARYPWLWQVAGPWAMLWPVQ